MRPRRIYLPLTHDQLRAMAQERALAAPVSGYAAAAPGRVDARISPAAAQEEAEYLAFRAAARDAARVGGGARRIVAAADAPPGSHRETSPEGARPIAVVTSEDLPLRLVVSLHVGDDAEDGGEIDADADEDADLTDADVTDDDGSEDDASYVDPGDDDGELDLLWYDITELDAVLADLGR